MPAEHKLAVRDGERVREVLLVGTVTVGRSPTCEISSADPRLSRTHAAFDVVGGEVVVRDLDSRNGTTVNGQRITEHRLIAGDRVEVGPFVVQLIETSRGVIDRPAPGSYSDDEATVMRSPRARQAAAPSAEAVPVAPATPPAAANEPHDSAIATRLVRRSPPAAAPPGPTPPPPAAREAQSRAEQPAPAAVRPASSIKPPPVDESAAVAPPKARRPATELTFANATLLWIVPLVLVSFLAALVPNFMQPDDRAPLLRAYYVALAASAVDLVKTSREPAMPIDSVTSALRRQAGVTSARIIAADGRVLAPLDQAGTTVASPPADLNTAPTIVATANGGIDVQVAARTADDRPVLVALTVDPERIHPTPPRSPIGTVLLIMSLGAAWLTARRLTTITDSRLSRLGEEVELMMTKQVSAGRDPFTLNGGQRILDAVTFALSSAGRVASGGPLAVQYADDDAAADTPATASIDADAAFRIVNLDRGCEGLLGINPRTAPGRHLIEAIPDQAVSDEVMRLLTMAAPNRVASGEAVSGDRGIRLGIDVTRGAGEAPLSIRFKRL